MIKATNNARGVSIRRRKNCVYFSGFFGEGCGVSRIKVRIDVLRKALRNLTPTGYIDIKDVRGKKKDVEIRFAPLSSKPGIIRIFFPPVNSCDLITVSSRGLMRALKRIGM